MNTCSVINSVINSVVNETESAHTGICTDDTGSGCVVNSIIVSKTKSTMSY